MKVRIEIDCDNAAFENAGMEVSRILTKLANLIYGDELDSGWTQALIDINGNVVGQCKVTGRRLA